MRYCLKAGSSTIKHLASPNTSGLTVTSVGKFLLFCLYLLSWSGIKQLRFKPAYNPYTEPSMEIFGYHPELGKWTEIGEVVEAARATLIQDS